MNSNLQHIGEYRLEIIASNLRKVDPEFAPTLKAAKARRRILKGLGYAVIIFHITNNGGLSKA